MNRTEQSLSSRKATNPRVARGNTRWLVAINDTTFELSVFWPCDTESQNNELRFSDSISISFKTRLMSVTCFCGNVTQSKGVRALRG